jgi:lipoprotein-anchoring transpeptidase ErfK/SrfK
VTDRVRTTDPNGAYGSFALGLSAHSDTLSEFGSGDGQIGIHGTNEPASLGKAVSHGCVRVPDSMAARLPEVPLGTPVVITA